jgi:hypothetical protein
MGTPLPKIDQKVSLDDASKKTKQYRDKPDHKRAFPFGAFHRIALDRILGQPGCVGIRAYPAENDDGLSTMVIVGVDESGNDMYDGELAQDMFLCPQYCSDENPLNGG